MELYDRRTAPKRHDTWFVYGLVDSRNPNHVRYVGITNDPRRRLSHHHSSALDSSTRRYRWVAKITNEGGEILMIVLHDGLSHEDAKNVERSEIASRKNLTNLTSGGDGTSGRFYSAETREKIAASRRGKPLSDVAKAKLSHINIGRTSPNKGKILSEQWRANISAGGVARMRDPFARLYLSEIGSARYADKNERNKTAVATRKSGPHKRNASGYKGVSFCKQTGRWVAQIKTDKRKSLGRFPTPELAALAYDRAAFEAWGGSCYLNFPVAMTASQENTVNG